MASRLVLANPCSAKSSLAAATRAERVRAERSAWVRRTAAGCPGGVGGSILVDERTGTESSFLPIYMRAERMLASGCGEEVDA